MDDVLKIVNQPLYSSQDITLTYGHALFGALGAVLLYYMIPSRKRKNLFK